MTTPTTSNILLLWFCMAAIAIALERLLAALKTGRTAPYAAGVIVGLLVGASLGPRLWTSFHASYVAVPEASEIDQIVRDIEAAQRDVEALKATGVSPAAVQEAARSRLENEAALTRYHAVRTLGGVIAAFLMGFSIPVRPIRKDAWRSGGFVAAWSLVIATGAVGVLAVFLFSESQIGAVCVGLAFAVLGLGQTLALRGHDVGGDETERLASHIVEATMIVGWCAGLVLVAALLVWPGEVASSSARPGVSWLIALGLIVGILCAGHTREIMPSPTWIGRGATAAVVAILVAQVDVFQGVIVGAIALGAIIGADARWIGVTTGLRLVSVPWERSWSASVKVTDAAMVQVATGGLLWMTGRLSGVMLIAIIAGAAIAEATVTLRPWLLELAASEAAGDFDTSESDPPDEIG